MGYRNRGANAWLQTSYEGEGKTTQYRKVDWEKKWQAKSRC
jgi:hypothetical protein